jgi:hypothetical protein
MRVPVTPTSARAGAYPTRWDVPISPRFAAIGSSKNRRAHSRAARVWSAATPPPLPPPLSSSLTLNHATTQPSSWRAECIAAPSPNDALFGNTGATSGVILPAIDINAVPNNSTCYSTADKHAQARRFNSRFTWLAAPCMHMTCASNTIQNVTGCIIDVVRAHLHGLPRWNMRAPANALERTGLRMILALLQWPAVTTPTVTQPLSIRNGLVWRAQAGQHRLHRCETTAI